MKITSDMYYVYLILEFKGFFPYFTKANCWMEPIENGQRHRNMGDYRSRPFTSIKLDLDWMRIRSVSFQRVDGPHGQVANQQKGHHLSSWFSFNLFICASKSTGRIQDKDCLQSGLHQRCQGCQKGQKMVFKLKKSSNNAKVRVDEDSSLSYH